MDNKNMGQPNKSLTQSQAALDQQKIELQTQGTENLRTIFKDVYGVDADDLDSDEQLIDKIMLKVPPTAVSDPKAVPGKKADERNNGVSKPADTADKVYGNKDTAKKYPIPANITKDPKWRDYVVTRENRIGTIQETGGSIDIPGTVKFNVYRPHDWDKMTTEDEKGKTFFNEQMLNVTLLHQPLEAAEKGAEV